MPYLNDVTIMGNLCKDPDLRSTPSGSPVCELTVAVNRKVKGRDDVCYIDVVVWGKSGENCRRYITKGSCVLIRGYLKQESWEDRNGSGRRTKLRIVAENIQFITTPKNAETRATGPNQSEYGRSEGRSPGYSTEYDEPEYSSHDQNKANGYQPQIDPPPSGPGGLNQGDAGFEKDIPF